MGDFNNHNTPRGARKYFAGFNVSDSELQQSQEQEEFFAPLFEQPPLSEDVAPPHAQSQESMTNLQLPPNTPNTQNQAIPPPQPPPHGHYQLPPHYSGYYPPPYGYPHRDFFEVNNAAQIVFSVLNIIIGNWILGIIALVFAITSKSQPTYQQAMSHLRVAKVINIVSFSLIGLGVLIIIASCAACMVRLS